MVTSVPGVDRPRVNAAHRWLEGRHDMKIEIWPDDTSMPEMNDWLAELRDDGGTAPLAEPGAASPDEAGGAGPEEPGAAGPAEPASGGGRPAALAEPASGRAWLAAPAEPASGRAWLAAPAEPAAPAESAGPGGQPAATPAAAPAAAAVRAVIGDQQRMPIMWCEMGSCISWHADPAALGECDSRARAIGAGWRIDAFGRLACPRCQQTDPGFRASRPVVLWDRRTAIARTARIAAMRSDPMATQRVR